MIDGIKIWSIDRKIDNRGWFLKLLNGNDEFRNDITGDVYFVCGLDKGIRGNHYHNITNEWFSAIKGSCELHLKDIRNGMKQVIEFKENQPLLVFVPCMVAHAFVSKENSEFIIVAFTDTIFDANDTISFDLI